MGPALVAVWVADAVTKATVVVSGGGGGGGRRVVVVEEVVVVVVIVVVVRGQLGGNGCGLESYAIQTIESNRIKSNRIE